MALSLLPHQIDALHKMHDGCVLKGGVGTGKTITSLWYFYEKVLGGTVGDYSTVGTPMDIYVFTTARKRDSLDWQKTGTQMGITPYREGSVAGIQLTVESYNNLPKYSDLQGAFIIFDEQRLVGSGAWSKAFLKMAKHNRWIMLSATPGDVWEDYIPLFLANGFYKNRSAFKREHIVYNNYGPFPKVDHYNGVAKLNRLKNQILVEMPMERHTIRHLQEICVDYDKDLFEEVLKKRWNPFESRPLRDVAEQYSTMRKVAYSDPSRIKALHELTLKHPKLIVFYNFDYELEALRQYAASRFPTSSPKDGSSTDSSDDTSTSSWAEWNGHKHQETPTTDRWLYLVQYVAGAEAWNCTTTDAMCFFSLTYSWKIFWQAQGRIDRLDTPFVHLYYYVLVGKSYIDVAVKRSLKSKESFNQPKNQAF